MTKPVRQSVPKLRRARFKDGHTLTVMPQPRSIGSHLHKDVDTLIGMAEANGRLAGYALVTWSQDGKTQRSINLADSPYAFDYIPDLVGRSLRVIVDEQTYD